MDRISNQSNEDQDDSEYYSHKQDNSQNKIDEISNKNDQAIQNMVNYCGECQKQFKITNSLYRHILKFHQKVYPKGSLYNGNLREGIINQRKSKQNNEESNINSFFCGVCQLKLSNSKVWKKHMELKHNSIIPPNSIKKGKDIQGKLKICKEQRQNSISEEKKICEKSNQYQCKECGKCYKAKKKLLKHYKIRHHQDQLEKNGSKENELQHYPKGIQKKIIKQQDTCKPCIICNRFEFSNIVYIGCCQQPLHPDCARMNIICPFCTKDQPIKQVSLYNQKLEIKLI